MAVVEIGGSDDGGLSIDSVGFRDVVHAVLEVGVRQLGEELPPLSHIFHGLHFCRFKIRVAGLEGKAVDVAYSAVELAVSRPYGLAGIVQTHPDWTCLCSYIQRRKEIVICLALPVAESACLVIIEFHVLVAQAYPDIETAKLLGHLHKCGYVAFVHSVGSSGDCERTAFDVCYKSVAFHCSGRSGGFDHNFSELHS